MKKTILLSFIMASMMLSAQNTIYVSTTGSDTNDGMSEATPVKTFSKAITKVTSTITEVILAPGTYLETAVADLKVPCPNLTIRGENAKTTIIQQTTPATRILFNSATHKSSSNNLTIQDLTFKNGSFTGGGGAAINYQEVAGHKNNLTLERVIFEDNKVTTSGTLVQNGGALTFGANTLIINNCFFKNNAAVVGATGTSGAGLTTTGGAISITTIPFAGTAPSIVYQTGLFVTINNTTFEGNTAVTKGGAIAVYNNNPREVLDPAVNSYLKCTNCTFLNNKATKNPTNKNVGQTITGSAVNLGTGTNTSYMIFDIDFVNCTFSGNKGGSVDGDGTVNESKATVDLDGKNWASATFVNNIINTPATANCGAALMLNYKETGKLLGSNNFIESILVDSITSSAFTADLAANKNLIGAMPNINLNTTLTDNSTASVFAVPFLELAAGSTAIDAGINSFGTPNIVPDSDVRGFIFAGSSKDCGAYEFNGTVLPINPVRLDNSVSVYPNPVRSTLYVNSNVATSFDVYSVNGNKVASYGSAQKSIDVSALSSGMYLLQFKTGRGIVVKTFIKK